MIFMTRTVMANAVQLVLVAVHAFARVALVGPRLKPHSTILRIGP